MQPHVAQAKRSETPDRGAECTIEQLAAKRG